MQKNILSNYCDSKLLDKVWNSRIVRFKWMWYLLDSVIYNMYVYHLYPHQLC